MSGKREPVSVPMHRASHVAAPVRMEGLVSPRSGVKKNSKVLFNAYFLAFSMMVLIFTPSVLFHKIHRVHKLMQSLDCFVLHVKGKYVLNIPTWTPVAIWSAIISIG